MEILSKDNSKLEQEQLDKVIGDIPPEPVRAEKQPASGDDAIRKPEYAAKLSTLLVVGTQPASTLRAEIAAGRQPRRDYYAIQELLGADIIHPNDALTTYFGRLVTRLFGPWVALIWAAFCRRNKYDILYTMTEIVALPLALLLKLSGTRPGKPRHVTLSHYLSPLKKRVFFWLGVASHIDTVIVHAAAQHALATKVLRLPGERVVKLPYFVDLDFWHPLVPSASKSKDTVTVGQPPMICAAGLECRDYATLISAVSSLNVEVKIAADTSIANRRLSARRHSQIPEHPAGLPGLPPNVSVKSYDYEGMRQLYAAAQFVVVPLLQRDCPAGITVILEAMAMGKAVIVSGTRGQTDVVRDPRNDGRGPVVREWWPGFLDTPDVAETLGSLPTGFYVTPGDVNEMRDTIQYLLNHPEIAEELGRNGRCVAEAYFGLDAFAKRFAAAIRGESLP